MVVNVFQRLQEYKNAEKGYKRPVRFFSSQKSVKVENEQVEDKT